MTVGALRTSAVAAALATAVSGIAVFWLAVRLPAVHGDNPAASAAAVPFVLGMIVLAATGALVARSGAGSTVAWLLVATGCAGVVGRLVFALAVLAQEEEHGLAPALGWVTNWVWAPPQVLALLLLSRFPDGAPAGPRSRWVERLVVGWGLLAVAVTATVPGPLGADQLAPAINPVGLTAAGGLLDVALGVVFAAQPVLLLLVVAVAVARWRAADPVARRQLALVAAALLVLGVTAPLAFALDAAVVLEGVAWLLVPGSIAWAVLRHGLWDVDLRGRLDRLRGVREAERARLQRDLHDSLGPMLGSIAMRVEAARNMLAAGSAVPDVDAVLASIGDDTERAVVEVRRFIDELGPSALADADLATALEELVARHAESGLAVELVRPEELPPLTPAAEIAVYRVAAEALRNVQRHADARRCRVSLRVEGGDVALDVVDDGVGLRGRPEGVGRRAMAERVAELGGTFALLEPREGGVRVSARLAEVVQ